MTARRLFRITLSTLVLGMAFGARAQSFNIDIDVSGFPQLGAGAPSSQFGAAAHQTGYWNEVSFSTGPPFFLKGLDGTTSNVLMTGPLGGGGVGFNNPNNTGDFGLLMNDMRGVGDPDEFTFSGLQDGHYRIFTYAATPADYELETQVTAWSQGVGLTKSVWSPFVPNVFVEGRTHSVHEFDVSNGTIHVRFEQLNHASVFNGMQIVAVPEPATLLVLVIGIGIGTRKKGKR